MNLLNRGSDKENDQETFQSMMKATTWLRTLAFLRMRQGRPLLPLPLKMLLTKPLPLLGVLMLTGFAAMAIGAPYLAPAEEGKSGYDVPRDGFKAEPQPPSMDHPFGTTQGQYDLYHAVVWGSRTAFKIGLIITAGALLLGLIIGSLAGYYGGWLDEILMRLVDVFMAFPFLLAAITLSAVIKSKAPHIQGIYVGMVALTAFAWMGYDRIIRGDIMAMKERDYVLAARSMGARGLRILVRHILPNAVWSTFVVASMDIGLYVVTFSTLSFLGLGAEEGYADWGQMVAFARSWLTSLTTYWYVIVFPGGAIVLFVLAWNLIGDALRDILDPRLRGGRL